jgi:putative membrane protein
LRICGFSPWKCFYGRNRSGFAPSGNPWRRRGIQPFSPRTRGFTTDFWAAGLIFGLFYPEPHAGMHIQVFFLICVIAAGAYGGYSVSPKILAVQAAPALLALIPLFLS